MASLRLSVPACDSQEYESVPEMWQATVPRWRGIKGVDGHKQEFRQVYSLNIHKVCRMGEAAAHPSIEILMLVQACSLNRNISVQSRTIEPAKQNDESKGLPVEISSPCPPL